MYDTIKEICKERHISVSSLERKAGIGNGTITKWNENSPSLDNLQKVADALGIKVTTLINRSRAKPRE